MALISQPLQAFGLVELSWVRASSACFERHTHDEYVLGANLRGNERIWLDGQTLEVPPGSVTLYNPLAVQASEFAEDGVEYISLHLDPDALRHIARDNNLQQFDDSLSFAQGVLHNTALYRAIVEFAQADAGEPAHQEEALLALLAQLLEQPTAPAIEQAGSLRLAMQLMRDTPQAKLALEDVAAAAGLSKYHFVRCFKKATGLAPLQYHMQLRLSEARRRLRDGLHPAEVADALGFYDQSHFINAFRRVMGVTPNSYWQAFRASARG
ncbi:AraC family transcriptional regulator [Pseudomonas sp. 5P_5.1_Bac1]|uniref:AraC family transcriptional regulator n=1 Tax=Pseudomonas sp. 5P_5.1_Bac1 TaxID=2971616 RepID=UPI0021C5AA7E|nr:AraC family transcriptional regulator [Pseudomonas sp. 5P_5.1_Bac1]MCU1722507.1 AraC family transcriptional regulator [Pseudomonas sp. 5P_5.1_Bac1]